MHPSARSTAIAFFEEYAIAKDSRVLELGSASVDDSLRIHLPSSLLWTGVDMGPGDGVDVVLDDPYELPFAPGSFDVCIATSVFEHNEMFWLSFLEMVRVAADGALIYVCSPSNGKVHRYPVDCYRFYPDAGIALQDWARRCDYDVTLVESVVMRKDDSEWNDWVAVYAVGPVIEPSDIRPRLTELIAPFSIGRGSPGFRFIEAEATEDQLDLHDARRRLIECENSWCDERRSDDRHLPPAPRVDEATRHDERGSMSPSGRTIGVVITARDAERHLDLALASVQSQTLRPHAVVVVDDGSTDRTAEIARSWQDRLPLRVVVNETSLGIGGGRRVGIDALDTEIVAVLDADDMWLPEHLAVADGLVGPMRVVSPLYEVWEDGIGLAGPLGSDRRRRRAERAIDQLPLLLRDNFATAGVVFTRELYETAGGYSTSVFSEDLDLAARFLIAGGRFVFPPAPTVLYRRHPGAISMGSAATQRETLATLDHIATFVPPSMRPHVDHARRVAAARILLYREHDEPRRSRIGRTRLLWPVLQRAPFRQKLSAFARIVR